jgi:hypothetical protein
METQVKKRRKTVDEYLGINGLLIVAIIGSTIFKGGLISSIGVVAGLSAIYYLIKKRKELDKKQKNVGWGLVVLWLILFGILNQQPSQ